MAPPAPSNRRLPAEWEPQAALWLSWPSRSAIWPQTPAHIQRTFAEITAAAARRQPVAINAPAAWHFSIHKSLTSAGADRAVITLYDHPNDDVWVRDHGPIFVMDKGDVIATDWRFNAWGGKFADYARDDAIAARIANALGLRRETPEPGFILEGGAIDSNGAGTLLVTEPVLLNPNRNPGYDRAAQEAVLRAALGVCDIIWLPAGLANDDTDGHVDNVARFVAADTVVAAVGQPALTANLETLRAHGLTVVELPLPDPVPIHGVCAPASYANFTVINDAVLLPTFGQPDNDARAAAILGDCFPTRDIVAVEARLLLEEGGALHCMSCNQPAAAD